MHLLFNTKLNSFKNQCGIYLIVIDKHKYIGSSINLFRRLREHRNKLKIQKHHNQFIQNCFNRYGSDKTYFKILTFCAKEERLQLERDYILKYDSDLNLVKDPTTQHNTITTSKEVHQYTLTGIYVQSYPSTNEAERILNITGIANAANVNITSAKSIGGFLWSYEKLSTIEYTNNSDKAKIKTVHMYDNNGVYLKTFDRIADAARYIIEEDDDFDSLCACISGVAHEKGIYVKGQYRYSFNKVDQLPPRKRTMPSRYKVKQIFGDGTYKIWDSVEQIVNELQCKNSYIYRVLNGRRKTYNNCR